MAYLLLRGGGGFSIQNQDKKLIGTDFSKKLSVEEKI